jgi:bacterioferritin-associated ferredoxin
MNEAVAKRAQFSSFSQELCIAQFSGSGRGDQHIWIYGDRPFLDSFQSSSRITLESLQNTDFLFASRAPLQYRKVTRITDGPAALMIVCSCNVLSDHDVRNAVESAQHLPRNAKQIYGCLGCSAECGRCARTIKTIINEALGACAEACRAGCPHRHLAEHQHLEDAVALATVG